MFNSTSIIIDNTGRTPNAFTSFIEGMNHAYGNNIDNVYVLGERYDLLEEFGYIYGENFLDNIRDIHQYGAPIGHGMHVYFPTNATLEFNYTGDNKYRVARSFSPIYAANGNFVLEGANIVARNARYCVHDDNNQSHESHEYSNCKMYLDNSDITSPQNAGIWRCIGGGFGYYCSYFVHDCEFEVNGIPQDGIPTGKLVGIVNYHDNAFGNEGSNYLYIYNNVFKGIGTAGATYYGNLETLSYVYIHNNTMGSEPYIDAETSGSHTNNLVLTQHDNVIQ